MKKILSEFKNPPSEYSAVPFWFWNDDLCEEHLLFQMKEMKDKGISEFIIHSRRGRSVEYLSEEWFEKVGFALEQAKSLDMRVWIYDEDNWPSGYAGEKVVTENPNYCAKHLCRLPADAALPENAKEVYSDEKYKYVSCYTKWNPAYSESLYTDLLSLDATECFIRHTHAEYLRRFPDYFGGTIKGFFVDEPGFYNNFEFYSTREDAGSYVWTDGFAVEFTRRKGYDLLPFLGCLWDECADSRRIRLDFYDVVCALYIDNFFAPIRCFCENVGVLLIGHPHSEEFMPYHAKTQGDLLRVLGAHHYPGIDRIDVSAEKITEKYASSAGHIYGKERVMSETFASSGLDLDMQRIKQWTDWQYVRGINMMVLHAFFSSVEGDRKWESPPSLFYQNFYWKYFKRYSDYVKRLSYILCQGVFSPVCALYYPITTQHELVKPDELSAANEHDRIFIDTANKLSEWQLDYDIVNDDALKEAKAANGQLEIRGMKYRFIVLPDIHNIPTVSLKKLAEFAESGGGVVYWGDCKFSAVLEHEAAEQAELRARIKASQNFAHFDRFVFYKRYTYSPDGEKLYDYARGLDCIDFDLLPKDSYIKYMKRVLPGAELYFIVNEENARKKLTVRIKAAGRPYIMDPEDGSILAFDSYYVSGDSITAFLEMDGYGSLLLLFASEDLPKKALAPARPIMTCIEAEITDFTVIGQGIRAQGKPMLWSVYGKPRLSGYVEYFGEFEADPKSGAEYMLELDRLFNSAEIYINGSHAGDIVWRPYRIAVTGLLRKGKNTLKIVVANTTGNELYQTEFPSGLLGPVQILKGE